MKSGLVSITYCDEQMQLLYRKKRNADAVIFSAPATSLAEVASAAMRLAMDNDIERNKAVVAVDGRECLLRNLRLPIRSLRQLDQVAAFELEEALPLGSDDVISDYCRAGYDDGMSYVTSASLRKDIVKELIGHFAEHGVVVERIEDDVAALARACL